MSRAVSLVFSRALLHAAIVAFAFCALPVAAAQAKVKVNCNLPGETISGALLLNVDVTPLVIQVKGTCTENIVIARDDVTIKTNGIAPAGVPEVHSWVPRHAFPPFVEEKLLAIRREVSGSGPVEPGEVLLCRGAGWAADDAAARTGLEQQYTAISRDLLQAHPTGGL